MPELERHELIEPIERAVAIFSHPDDAEFGAAATIASLVARGARVDYVVTTDGGKGTDDPSVSSEQLAATPSRNSGLRQMCSASPRSFISITRTDT